MTERFVGTIAAIATTQVLIAAARRFLDRPVPIVRELTDASFVIYLFHLPLIVLLVWLAQSLPIPAVVKALGVAAGSGLGSYGVWLLVARDRGMSLLFDGVFSRPARPVPA
jgi:glucan biosynthesis protein C